MLRWATFAAFILAVDGFSAPGPMLGLRHRSSGAASVRMVASPLDMEDEKMGWWDAPRRIVASDGGMRAKGLYYWLLDEHNVDLSRVELKQSELEGLGIFAKDDMEPGEPIFDVPRSCTIYPELVFADRGLGGSMQKLASASGTGVEVVALATFLAKEKLKGSESTFRPYIECLPWDATHPLMWTDDEVELLKGTYAYDEILGFRDQVDAATEIFEPVLNPKGWKQLFQPIDSGNMDSDEFAFLMRGAFASVLSRAYDSDIAGGSGGLEQRVLIPLMDSLNHAGSRGPSVTFDCTNSVGGEDDIRRRRIPVGVAAREGGVRAGEELLSYYGAKPNWNFLTSYGFVSDEDVSQETTLTASLDPSDGLFSAKREALARLGLASEEQLFDIQASEPPSAKVFAYLRIASATSESELGGDALAGELSAENEKAAKEMLGRLAAERREFLDSSKQAAVDAAKNGQETGVRRDVAKLVCDLLDSEGAALDTLAPLIVA